MASAGRPLRLVSVTTALKVPATPWVTVSVGGATLSVKMLVSNGALTVKMFVSAATPGIGLLAEKAELVAQTATK